MPLRDHFRPPLDARRSWDELHGAWPTVMVMALNQRLPPRYVAAPRVHLGAYFEVDVASFDDEESAGFPAAAGEEPDGTATAVWAPQEPTLAVATDLPDQEEYEVRVYDIKHQRRLETWAHALAVGQPLPTLPLWLRDDLAVPMELESTYEETCRISRMP